MYEGKTILTIDDEAVIRSSFRELLEDNNYNVLEAENGRVGIEVFTNNDVDLVLCDLRMPEVDGIEVLKHIKKVSPNTPVIVASGTGILVDALEAIRIGADDYILKPVEDLDLLIYAIEKAFEHYELIESNKTYQNKLESLIEERTKQLHKMVIDLKEKNKKIHKSEQNISIAFESMTEAVIIVDNNLIIQRFNNSFTKMVSIEDKSFKGDNINHIFNVLDYSTEDEIENPINDVLKTGKKFHSDKKFVIETSFHKKIIVHFTITPIVSRKDDISGILMIISDITKRVNLEEDIIQIQKMDAIGQIAGGVAHDFNNVLGGIIGSAEILALKLAGQEDLLKLVNIIKDSGKRAGALTSKLLDFSRKQKITKETFDVHKSVYKAIHILERSIDPIINIKVEMRAKLRKIIGDASQLENILINLGVNARDVLPDGGDIIFKSRNISFDEEFCDNSKFDIKPGEYIEISVEDTGLGMSNEVKEKVFEPFFTTKEKGKGTGLGLASVFNSVVRNQGFITIDSELGVGSVFQLFYPISENSIKEIEQEAVFEFDKSKLNILVVDDELIIRSTYKSMLSALGINVEVAENGLNAIEMCKVRNYNLILLDLLMPTLSGEQTFYKLKEILPKADIIIISGFSEDEKVEKLLDDGAKDFLAKPFNIAKLIVLLNKNFKDKY